MVRILPVTPSARALFSAALAVAVLAAAALPAQVLPAARAALAEGKVPPEQGALVNAREAIAAGDLRAARGHLLGALGVAYRQEEVVEALLAAAGDDVDARALWGHVLVGLVANPKGKGKLSRELKALMPVLRADSGAASAADAAAADKLVADPHPEKVAAARADAVHELLKLAVSLRAASTKLGGTPLGARWAAALAWELMEPSPQLVAAHADGFNQATGDYLPQYAPVVDGLLKIMSSALGKGELGNALRAARCLRGLAAQTGFKDLQGAKPPDLSAAAARAGAVIDDARVRQRAAQGEPLSIAQLQAMTEEERARFTAEHAEWPNPGIAVSPKGLYRVETVCGFETLLGVASTIEDHHHRLVGWYGSDPFAGRPGLVRVVPRHSGLESEGTPFWWAGGFQSGDTTTVQFAVGNIEGLGHTLTHELTHRFDGAVFPGMPAWVVEGRAVWTAAAYGSAADAAFVDRHLLVGTVEGAFIKGYGGKDNLEKLITGTLDDYRDNYVAGYALWAYLRSWSEGGKPLYRGQLDRWMQGAPRGLANPLKWFTAHFADGKDGRPKSMDEFTEQWAAFLKGCHWQSRAEWLSRYVHHIPSAGSEWVYDTPTWHRQRARAEPYFGQDQARDAGDLFWELGMRDAALFAYVWSLEVDEWEPEVARRLADLLEERHEDDLAWILRAEVHRKLSAAGQARDQWQPVAAPFLRGQPELAAYLAAQGDGAAAYREHGMVVAAAALAADRDRAAAFLGLPPVAPTLDQGTVAHCAHPLDEPAVPLGLWGWVEDGLTDHEERRVPGLWYVTEDGDVIVGREKPRAGTGEVDRGLWQREAFVRSCEWQAPGRYLLETRVFFSTSYVSGTIVLGYTRRDRNLRFRFSAGDFLYSAGEKETFAGMEGIGWSFGDLRGRDGGLPGSALDGHHEFAGAQGSFRMSLLVDGAEVHVFIEDQWSGSYHTIDGRPVEGYIGFAVDQGSVQLQQPTVRRLDRGAACGLEGKWPRALNLAQPSRLSDEQLRNRLVRGVPVGEHGTVLVWLPVLDDLVDGILSEEDFVAQALDAVRSARQLLDEQHYPMQLVAAVPRTYSQACRDELANQLSGSAILVTHAGEPPPEPTEDNPFADICNMMLLLDEHGVLRAQAPYLSAQPVLPGDLGHWARVLRGRK